MNQEKTIAQQLGVTEFPFIIKDAKGNKIYYEYSNGSWFKREYDANDNLIYREDSKGKIVDNRPKTKEIADAIKLLTDKGLIVDGKILK